MSCLHAAYQVHSEEPDCLCRQTQPGSGFSNGIPGPIAQNPQQAPPGLQGPHPQPPFGHFSSMAPGLSQPGPSVNVDFSGAGSHAGQQVLQQGPPPGISYHRQMSKSLRAFHLGHVLHAHSIGCMSSEQCSELDLCLSSRHEALADCLPSACNPRAEADSETKGPCTALSISASPSMKTNHFISEADLLI